jgi:hypothetical protein
MTTHHRRDDKVIAHAMTTHRAGDGQSLRTP